MEDGKTKQTPELPISELNKEHLKLAKNSRGYTWEIKIIEINIERLEELNNQMIEKFGGSK